jgi:hypothetical protein
MQAIIKNIPKTFIYSDAVELAETLNKDQADHPEDDMPFKYSVVEFGWYFYVEIKEAKTNFFVGHI